MKKALLCLLSVLLLLPMAMNAQYVNENFENLSTGASPTGWSVLSGTVAVYSGTYSCQGNQSLKFSGSLNNIIVLPEFSVEASQLELTVNMRPESFTNASCGNFQIGYVTDAADASTFVALSTTQYNDFSSCIETSVTFTAAPSGSRIAFRHQPTSTAWYWFVDEVNVHDLPSCVRPVALTASNVTDNSFDFSFTPAMATDNSWQTVIVPHGTPIDESLAIAINSPSYQFTGLQGNTKYDVYVRTDCGTEYSAWSQVLSVLTACPDYMAIPYNQDFETYAGATSGTTANIGQACWSQISTGTITTYAGYPIIYNSATYAQSGTNSVRFYSYTTATYGDEYAVMPPVDVTAYPMNTLQVEFGANKYSTYSLTLIVGVMDDSATVASFVPVDTIVVPTTETANAYSTYIVSFENYTGTGNRIAFMAPKPTTSYNAGCIDDIIVSLIPNCKKPMEVAVSNLTASGATVSWEPQGDENAWDVVVVEQGASVDTGTPVSASLNSFEITGLTDNTEYDVYVRANCGGDVSDWSNIVSFTTRCLPNNVFPYTENFENYGTTSYVSFPNCWTRMTNATNQYPYVSSTYNHDGALGSLYFYATASYYSLATTELMDMTELTPGSMKVDFNLYKTSASYGRLDVGYMTDATDINTFVVMKSIYPGDFAISTWTDYSIVLPNEVYNQPVYIAFYSPAITTSYVYLDGVAINEVPDCFTPEDLAVATLSGSTAVLEWTDAPFGDNDYVLAYSESGLDSWTSAILDGTTYTITGLTSGTQYDVMLYSNCPESDTLTLSFTTRAYVDCLQPGPEPSEISVGTSITEYYVPVSNFYKYCYTQQIFTADEIDSTHTPTVITGLAFQYGYTTAMTSKTDVKLYLAHRSTSTFASTTDWTPISSATLVYEGNLNCTSGWNTFTFDTPFSYNGTDNLVVIIDDNSYAYNGTAYVFNAHTPGSSSNYVSMYYQNDSSNPDPANPPAGTRYASRSDIKFYTCGQTAPLTCAPPVITDVTSDFESVTVSWIPGLDETAWVLEYKADGQTDWTPEGNVTTSPYVISNLTANTLYQIRIKSDCGGSEYSDWATTSKRTTCSFVALPFMENFEGASGSGSSYTIPCWTKGTNNSTQYPYPNSAQHFSGNYALYFYGTSTNYSYAASPRFEDGIEMDSLMIQFQAYKTSAAYYIEVGIMEDPDDYSTFTTLGQFTPSAISTWEMGEIRTSNYTGNGRHIAFRLPAAITNYMYLDDISVSYIPSCQHVENVHVVASTITATTADIAWTAGGDETEWDVVYGPSGTIDFDNLNPTTVFTNSISLTDLTGNTLYDVYVKANCGFGESTWMPVSFRTACVAVSSLPYMDDFDSYGTGTTVYPFCWGKINTYSVDRPYINTTSYSAPGAMYFYAGTAGTYNMAIAPEFDATIPVNTLQVSFMYRASYISDRLVVGVMTNPSDASTFVPVDTVAPTATATWEEKNVMLTSYTGTGTYIAFKNDYTTTSSYGYIDNLVVDVAPGCDTPTDLAVGTVSSSSADLSWNDDASQSSWQVYVYADSETPDFTQATTVTTNNYTATGLTANTVYHAYVRTVCADGSGHSNWRNVEFMTTSANIAQVPYAHDFEDATENAEWMLYNANATNKWYIGQPTNENSNVLFISNNGTAETYTISSAASTAWAFRDVQFGNASEFTLKFNWKGYGEGTTTIYDYLKVYIGTPAAVQAGNINCTAALTTYDPAGAEVLGVYNLQDNWQTATITLNGPDYSNTTKRLYFRWSNDGSGGTAPAAVVDSIEITASNCGRPYDLVASNVTNVTANVTFSAASANDNAWEYLIGSSIFNPDLSTDVPTPVTSTTFTIDMLTANTPYYVYVRTVCAGGEYSEWSDVLSFRTDCEALTTLPFSENFDNVPGQTTGTTNNLPSCWDNLCGTYASYAGYPIVYSTTSYAVTGNSLRFYSSSSASYDYGNQYAILPTIDVNALPINNLQLSFDARKYSTTYATFTLYVGVMSDPADASTFVPVDTILVNETTYDNFTVYFNNYSGNGNRIALCSPQFTSVSINAGNIDNIVLEVIPTCPKPQNLAASNATTSSIDLAWTETGSATAWNIEYGPTGFTQGTGTVVAASTNPFTVTGLNPSSNYDFYVQADCGGGDVSTWSAGIMAATQCGLITLPYTENFDSYSGTTYNTAGPIPTCWTNTSNNATYGAPHVTGNGTYSYPNSAPNALTFTCSSAGADAYAVLPEFTDALNSMTLAFAYRMENASNGTMTVGYVTDVNNIATSFQTVATLTSTTTITLDTISFENVPATTTGRLAFHWYQNGTFYSCGIDDISVFSNDTTPVVTTCDAPTALAASNIAQTSATINWTAGGTETAWNLQYKAASAADWSASIAVNNNPTYNLTGLTANTAYQVRVQAACSATETSTWTTANFTTAAEEQCPAPTNFRAENITLNSVTLAWEQAAGTANEWEINYKQADATTWTNVTVTTNPYTITDLTPETAYQAQIIAHCVNGVNSDATEVITFTTLPDGINDYVLDNSTTLYPNPTTGIITVHSSQFTVNTVNVYDVYGKLLMSVEVSGNVATIDATSFAAGVYFAKVETEKGVVTKRFVKK